MATPQSTLQHFHNLGYKGRPSRYKTALILAGGGSRAAVEAGILKVILHKIIPEVIIGTSAGAINGAFLASGCSPEEMIQHWKSVSRRTIFPLNKDILPYLWKVQSIFTQMELTHFLQKNLPQTQFKDLLLPLYVNATRLKDGKGHYFSKGPLTPALLASTAIPPYYPPYCYDSVSYIDGGSSQFIGADKAYELHCQQLIIITTGYLSFKKAAHTALEITRRAMEMFSHQIVLKELEVAKLRHRNVVIIDPPLNYEIHITDFSQTERLIKHGINEGRKKLRQILL